MAAVRTHYEILNVAPDAELVVIEAAYRALMKKYHPDQGGGAAEGPSAADINRAYAVLRDAERRADYDHKEWIRQRDISLAAYQPPPPAPRVPLFFGWGGWLVAAVLAGMIALMASRGGAPVANEAEQNRAAAAMAAAPDLRTQPLAPDKSLVTTAEAAEIRADAYAARPEAPKPATPVPAPPAPQAPQAVAAPAVPVAEAPGHRPLYSRHRPPPRRHAATRHDKDFLERQGYIY